MNQTSFDVRTAQDPDEEAPLGELQVAEYVLYLLALDTYIRYLEEASGKEDVEDELVRKGIRLLRAADAELEIITGLLRDHLPSDTHKRMLDRALRVRAFDAQGVGRRAFQIRTTLSLGGAGTMRGVFKTQKALRMVKEAIAASMLDNADAALDKFAAVPTQNARLRVWIDKAAETAGSGDVPQTLVGAGVKETATQSDALLAASVQPLVAQGAEAVLQAQTKHDDSIAKIESEARDAAKKVMDLRGEADEPPTRSEVVGLAVAAAAAAMSDPSKPQNIPEPLRELDDEQRAAALTDGKVGVFAGAGSGKSSTLVARVAYLVKDRRVNPSRILVTSFNTKSAHELRTKIGKAAGADAVQQMSVGTMHSLFARFVREFGTSEEKMQMGAGFTQAGNNIAYTVQRVWEDCFKNEPPPRLKDVLLKKAKWSGNNVSPQQAMTEAAETGDPDDLAAAKWYAMYDGLKAGTWAAPCNSFSYEKFMTTRKAPKLGDFTDMLKIFRDILARDPAVRSKVQGMFDHIIVDEAQDRNTLMADIIDMMSGHVTDGADGKSVWIVGDDKQAINSFQGARASLFKDLYEKDGWKTRVIRTNYRCEPELVEGANLLISYNDGNVPIPQNAAPGRDRGRGSIRVEVPEDEADAALRVADEVKQNMRLGEDVASHAVLCRTNKEIHAYETACIIRGIPYARRGAGSFFGSPETQAVLGYVQLATGTDYSKMQKALGQVINNPRRFFITEMNKLPEAVDLAFDQYARETRVDIKSLNPVQALLNPRFQKILADNLGRLTRTKKSFKFDEKLHDLGMALEEMQARSKDSSYSTKDLFGEILSLEGVAIKDGKFVPQTFRESLQGQLRDAISDEDTAEEDEEDSEDKGLGNITFLYKLAEIDPTDEDDELNPPTTPAGFGAKMSRYAAKMRDLRTDINKWNKDQQALPPERQQKPPGVYLGTVHATKGAQWKHAYVQMPAGKFPMMLRAKPGAPPPPPEKVQEQLEDERRLAYVAVTRAARNLRVVCPKTVGGKPAGVSMFVDEAGWSAGENVKILPGDPPSESVQTPDADDGSPDQGDEPSEYDYSR